jgi:hypothetical protein
MYNTQTERSAGWSGLAFAAVIVAAVLVPGIPPLTTSPTAADVSAYVEAHRTGLGVAAWLAFPAMAFFLWFAAGLRSYLLSAPGLDDGLPAYMLLGAIGSAGLGWLTAVCQTVEASVPIGALGGGALLAIYQVGTFAGIVICGPLAIFLIGASHSMRRHGSGPSWLVWLGYAAAGLNALGTLACIPGFGAASLAVFAGFALLIAWTVGASVNVLSNSRH